MRPSLALTLLVVGALPARGEDPPAIPRHPSQLVFPQASWSPPHGSESRIAVPGGPLVFFVEDHSLPIFDLVAAARIGSFLDPPDRPGAATVATELLIRGGTTRMDPDAFDAAVERLGGRVVARSGATNSAVGIDGPSWASAELLDLFLDLLLEPGFDRQRLRSLTGNLLEGMRRRNDDPVAVVQREWERLLYGTDHFSTRPLVPADLDALDRATLSAFHHRFWRPENLILAVSGDLDREAFLAALRDRLGRAAHATDASEIPWPPPAPRNAAHTGVFLLSRDLPQAKVLLGHRLQAVAPHDRPALALAAEVLGGSGAVSRIQGRLRTAEGLVYRSSTAIEAGELWPGELRVFFETRPGGTARAVELVRDEIVRIREQPVPPRELEAARASLLSRLRVDFDTPEEIAGRLAENALYGRDDGHWPAWSAALAAAGADAVRDAARRYLRPDELTVVVLGPLDAPNRERLVELTGGTLELLPERDPATQEPIQSPSGSS